MEVQCTDGESCKTITLLSHSSELRVGKSRIEFFLKQWLSFFCKRLPGCYQDPVCKLAFVMQKSFSVICNWKLCFSSRKSMDTVKLVFWGCNRV